MPFRTSRLAILAVGVAIAGAPAAAGAQAPDVVTGGLANPRGLTAGSGRLQQPTGIAVGPGGAVYESNRGGSGTAGQIVRLAHGG